VGGRVREREEAHALDRRGALRERRGRHGQLHPIRCRSAVAGGSSGNAASDGGACGAERWTIRAAAVHAMPGVSAASRGRQAELRWDGATPCQPCGDPHDASLRPRRPLPRPLEPGSSMTSTASAAGPRPAKRRRLAVRRLPEAGPSLEVILIENATARGRVEHAPMPPHRHDYHELIWIRRGIGGHLVDGERFEVGPHTLTLIRRGQVHVFERATDVDAAVIASATSCCTRARHERTRCGSSERPGCAA
jgi:mannose-6-phosphate isomerase-like protein (cupin superfamily)